MSKRRRTPPARQPQLTKAAAYQRMPADPVIADQSQAAARAAAEYAQATRAQVVRQQLATTQGATVPNTAGGIWPSLTAAQLAAGASAGIARPLPRPQDWAATPFAPGSPLFPSPINPVHPDSGRAEPRAFEYPVSWNLPGFGNRLVPWKVLRDAADQISLFRRCIEIRKSEVATLDWDVVISAKALERAQRTSGQSKKDVQKALAAKVEPEIGRLVDFWDLPDREEGLDFIGWASKVLEDYFVLDAVGIYPRYTNGGKPYAFEVIDATMIKPLLNAYGRRPVPPDPAYQVIQHGFPRGEFVADVDDDGNAEGVYPSDVLSYTVHNVRSWTPYGLSAVEQALYDGELFLRRMDWLKKEYTDGTMPAGWLMAGDGQADWTPDQLIAYSTWFNDLYMGQSGTRQRHPLLPFGMHPVEGKTDQSERYKPEYDLYLLKLVAAHFDTTIAELGHTEPGGLGSSGYHEGQADVQDRKATQPTLRRLQALCTRLMRRYLDAPPELEFRILGLESEDEDAADEVADRRVKSGRQTLNEDRDRTGLPRYTFPEADMPMVDTGRGVVFLEGASQLGAPGTLIGPPQAPPALGQPAEDVGGQQPEPGQPGQPGQQQPVVRPPAHGGQQPPQQPPQQGNQPPAKPAQKTDAPLTPRELKRNLRAATHQQAIAKADSPEVSPSAGPKSSPLARVGTGPASRRALGSGAAVGFDWGAIVAGEAGR